MSFYTIIIYASRFIFVDKKLFCAQFKLASWYENIFSPTGDWGENTGE